MEMIVVAEDEKRYSEWHGVSREKINWYPVIDYEKCVGCGMCAAGCGRNVYDWNFKRNRPVVARPNNCLVGCVTCSNTCLRDAISFPDKEYVRKVIRENKVLVNVKKEIESKFRKKPKGDCGCTR
jgi:NAD-dependent dihydropyrimidine dehydrogenase PreA subunit